MSDLSLVDRLAIASHAAPRLRSDVLKNTRRRVKIYRQETGETVGEISLAEAQKGILALAAIEFDVVDDRRPDVIMCVDCGVPVKVPGTGRMPIRCKVHALERSKTKQRERQSKPAAKAKKREYHTKPAAEAKKRERAAKPEAKAKRRERAAKPEAKAKNRARMAKRRAKKKADAVLGSRE